MNWFAYSLNVAIICLLQFAGALFANAQPPGGIFYHLTTKNGLSSNRANAVIQDREGFYWIATQDGLNRFDGSTCKIFRNIKNDSTSLSHNNCIRLLEDDNGDIWVATPRGVNRYIRKEGRFERYYLTHPTLSFNQANQIRGMAKDEAGNVLIASAGLWQYNIYRRVWTRFLNDPANPASIPAGFFAWLQYDKFNKGLWMTNSEFVFFDPAAGKFYHSGYNPGNLSIFNYRHYGDGFILDSAGAIWFQREVDGEQLYRYSASNNEMQVISDNNLSKGVSRAAIDAENRIWFTPWFKNTEMYDPRTNKTDTNFLAYYHRQSPLSAKVNHLFVDRSGIYWISSANGISIYDPRAQGVKYYWLADNRKGDRGEDNSITCLAEQNENIIWIGTATALYHYDLRKKKSRAIENLPLTELYIQSLYIQHDSILWIGGWNELLLFDLRSEKTLKKIHIKGKAHFISPGDDDDIWVGSWTQGLFRISNSGRVLNHFMKGQDSARSLRYGGLTCFTRSVKEPCFWIGYNFDHGFFKFNYRDHTLENFKIPTPASQANTINSVYAISEDKLGNLWIGTYGDGLVYFDRQKGSYTAYSQSEGLKGNYVNKILQDDQSNTWVTTTNGLSVIDARTNSIINSEIDISYENNEFLANGIPRKNKKLLFFSGLKIVEIDPVLYLQSDYASKLLLSNFKIFEKETLLAEGDSGKRGIELSYSQNFFSFEYSLLKPDPETSTTYAYKLDGFDKDWNYVRDRRTAYYTNVPPGRYAFQVKATDKSGQWKYFSAPVSIIISPPFWKTWWFYVLCGAAILTAIIFTIRNRINQLNRKQKEQLRLVVATQEKEKKNISAELHDDLGVRLSALKYFVTSLKGHLSPNDPKGRETYNKTIATIDESVEDIRYLLINLSPKTLNEYGYLTAVEDLVNKLSQLHIIRVTLHQKGMDQRLHPDIEAGLYRITQELINNTLKHAEAGSISLHIEKSNGLIQLHYQDDGKGFELSKSSSGYGMENIHTRVALLNGKIEWNTGTNQSTKVSVSIPYNHT